MRSRKRRGVSRRWNITQRSLFRGGGEEAGARNRNGLGRQRAGGPPCSIEPWCHFRHSQPHRFPSDFRLNTRPDESRDMQNAAGRSTSRELLPNLFFPPSFSPGEKPGPCLVNRCTWEPRAVPSLLHSSSLSLSLFFRLICWKFISPF